jgi:hypothetical protein
MWRKNEEGYGTWLKEKIESHPVRSHGFRYRGRGTGSRGAESRE